VAGVGASNGALLKWTAHSRIPSRNRRSGSDSRQRVRGLGDNRGMTSVRIGVKDDALLPLYRWLGEDPDVQRDTTLSLSGEQRPDEMSDTLDVINVVLSNTIAFSSLVTAIVAWLGTQRDAPPVQIERDGVRVTINDDSPETIRRVIEALSQENS